MSCFSKNDNDYMLLSSNFSDTLFLFIHGYGSSPLDLLPLAKEIYKKKYNCALLLLKGHGKDEKELSKYRYEDWKQQIIKAINYYKNYKKIYIIGFSIGATLAIDVAGTLETNVINGIVGISTFIKPTSKILQKILNISSYLRIKKVPRLLQITNKITKKEIVYSNFLPVKETKIMIDEIKSKDHIFTNIECDTFLLHSIDDKVADYYSVLNQTNNNVNIKLITFRNLNHFMQFDIPQQILSETILKLLEPQKTNIINTEMIKDSFSHMSTELNHWSGIMYKLITGFFSIFGALVYFSLPDILAKKSTTPYYLTSYVLLNCIFIMLATMYFFYINRTNVFLKFYIEPYLNVMPWTTYRTNKFLSGIESVQITNKIAIVILGVPMMIATGSLIYVIYEYMTRYIFYPTNNILLIVSFVISLFLYYSSFSVLRALQNYTTRELYNLLPQKFDNIEQSNMIINLYNSINIGCVKQECD